MATNNYADMDSPDYTTNLGHGEERIAVGGASPISRPATPPTPHSLGSAIRRPSPLLTSLHGVEGRSEL